MGGEEKDFVRKWDVLMAGIRSEQAKLTSRRNLGRQETAADLVENPGQPRVVIAGVTGLLGRALSKEFKEMHWDILGLAFSRTTPNMIEIDLTSADIIKPMIKDYKPDLIINCASQRTHDKIEEDYATARRLNVWCPKFFAKLAAEVNARYLFLSSDYVFDGENPPYKESDIPNPINKYGITKRDAEQEVMTANPDSCILRVSVMYGDDEEYIGESEVSYLLKDMIRRPLFRKNLTFDVSNYEIRFPSLTSDIAHICYELIKLQLQHDGINSIFHWCGSEGFTKYQMQLILSEEFHLDRSYITPVFLPRLYSVSRADRMNLRDLMDYPDLPLPRPQNCQLSCERLKSLGIGKHTPFRDGVKVFKDLLLKYDTNSKDTVKPFYLEFHGKN